MQLLLSHAGVHGKFIMSHGFKEGDKVIVTEGPLKDIHGDILFINEKKRKAKVKLILFGKEMEIAPGIELISKNKFHYN